jgi:hypothetical protein
VRRGTADPLLSLEALVGVSHCGLGVHVREQQQCNRGAQKWSRDAEQSPPNCSGITPIERIEGKGGNAGRGSGNAPISRKSPQPHER